MTRVWISATGTSAVVVISWVGNAVGTGLNDEVHDADHTAVTVNVEVGNDWPALTGWFALEWVNMIEHDVEVAPSLHGTPGSSQVAGSAPGALSSTRSNTASTCAHVPDAIDARTLTVTGAPSTHTHVSRFTTVAPTPPTLGDHPTVPAGRSVNS